jgi:hypothetical protein
VKGATMATAHLKECVQLLLARLYSPVGDLRPSCNEKQEAIAAAFELIDQPWDFTGAKDVLIWREGYEQCMKDIVDAIADEWDVFLPADPLRKASDGGDQS